VIVLGPSRDFFGNGIHLNVIQAASAGPVRLDRLVTQLTRIMSAG
jgi:hypothetical protein